MVGGLFQEGAYHRDTSLNPAPPIVGIWPNSQRRCDTRSMASGLLHAETLRGEAMRQVKLGWLAPPSD